MPRTVSKRKRWQCECAGHWQTLSQADEEKLNRGTTKRHRSVKISEGTVHLARSKLVRSDGSVSAVRQAEEQEEPAGDYLCHLSTVAQMHDAMKGILPCLASAPCPELACRAQTVLENLAIMRDIMQLTRDKEQAPPKPAPVPTRGWSADDLFFLTKGLADRPWHDWSADEIQEVVRVVRQINCYWMRGEAEAKQALVRFQENLGALVTARADIREMLDPEVIVLDLPWDHLALAGAPLAPIPAGDWQATEARAIGNLPQQVTGLDVPAPPPTALAGAPPLPPAAALAGPAGAAPPHPSWLVYSTNGPAHEANHFGGFMHGKWYGHLRGYWRISSPVAPTYY